MTRSTELTPPVLGRPSTAAATPALLRSSGASGFAGYQADGGDSRWCSLRAASVVGVRHRLAGQSCEDAFAWAVDDATVVVAVGDGLGAVPGSGATSARATRAAASAGRLHRADAVGSAHAVADAIADAIDAANRAAVGGGATTLVVAVVPEAGPVLVGRVGDSTAFVVDSDGAVIELFAPPDDGAVATGTDALPADDPAVQAASAALPLGAVLVLATDGAADPWRDGPTTVAPAFADTLTAAPTPLELLRLADFSRQGCHDDRTIVAVWRRDTLAATTGHLNDHPVGDHPVGDHPVDGGPDAAG